MSRRTLYVASLMAIVALSIAVPYNFQHVVERSVDANDKLGTKSALGITRATLKHDNEKLHRRTKSSVDDATATTSLVLLDDDNDIDDNNSNNDDDFYSYDDSIDDENNDDDEYDEEEGDEIYDDDDDDAADNEGANDENATSNVSSSYGDHRKYRLNGKKSKKTTLSYGGKKYSSLPSFGEKKKFNGKLGKTNVVGKNKHAFGVSHFGKKHVINGKTMSFGGKKPGSSSINQKKKHSLIGFGKKTTVSAFGGGSKNVGWSSDVLQKKHVTGASNRKTGDKVLPIVGKNRVGKTTTTTTTTYKNRLSEPTKSRGGFGWPTDVQSAAAARDMVLKPDVKRVITKVTTKKDVPYNGYVGKKSSVIATNVPRIVEYRKEEKKSVIKKTIHPMSSFGSKKKVPFGNKKKSSPLLPLGKKRSSPSVSFGNKKKSPFDPAKVGKIGSSKTVIHKFEPKRKTSIVGKKRTPLSSSSKQRPTNVGKKKTISLAHVVATTTQESLSSSSSFANSRDNNNDIGVVGWTDETLSNRSSSNIRCITNHPVCTRMAYDYIRHYPRITTIELYIVTSICEGIVYPMDSGLGGGTQIVIYAHHDRKGYYVNARERAPSNVDALPKQAEQSPESIGVPSILRGYEYIYQHIADLGYRRGPTVPWDVLFRENIKLARANSFIAPRVHELINLMELENLDIWHVEKDRMSQPVLADFLASIATNGPTRQPVYRYGSMENRIMADELRRAGSGITAEDISNYNVTRRDAMYALCEDFRVYTTHLPGSGLLQIFGCRVLYDAIRRYDYLTWSSVSRFIFTVRVIHQMQSLQFYLPYFDTDTLTKSLLQHEVPLVTDYIVFTLHAFFPTRIARRIGELDLPLEIMIHTDTRESGTSNICVSDDEVDLCATSTINWTFGSKVHSTKFGFFYNNQLADFTYGNRLNPNRPRPNAVPFSSISPTIFVNRFTDELEFEFGAAGGYTIVASNFFALTELVYQRESFRRSLLEQAAVTRDETNEMMRRFMYDCNAVQAARRCAFVLFPTRDDVVTQLDCEYHLPLEYSRELTRLGHRPNFLSNDGYSALTTIAKNTNGCYDIRRGGIDDSRTKLQKKRHM